MKTKELKFKIITLISCFVMLISLNSTMQVKAQNINPEPGSMEKYANEELGEIIIDNSEISLLALSGDAYEKNNGPAVATADRYNKITYATIHEESDTDWYKLEILDKSKPISLILTNIPNGCDYDMYLIKYDSTNGITKMYNNVQSGNVTEVLQGTVDEIGTYYVVIQPDTSVTNNYSLSNYKLYFGDYYRVSQYGYVDTGFDINFGYIAVGNTTPIFKGWYTYNLTNEASIPNGAIVTKIYLTGKGNGANWGGFYKMMTAVDQGITLEKKLGQMDLMYSGDNELLAKQRWNIGGQILSSSNFVWEPKILIGYKFPVTIENLRFL